MSIGYNIRRMRRAKDITQEQLSQQVGISRQWLAQFENGFRVPNVAVAKAIAEVLGCTLDELAQDKIAE